MNPDICTPATAPGLAARLLADTDCQAFGLVERGYAALADPTGPVSAALTSLMVIAVALFGYRLLLGRGLALSDAVGLAIKLGVVLLIAGSFAAWSTLAYDTLARAPTRIASTLVTASGAPEPLASLQSAIDRLDQAGIGWRTRAGIASPFVGGPPATAMTLNLSAILLTLSTVGLLVGARVVLALLLALAPAMAGFLLFASTRGLAEGWLRAMIAAAFTPIAVLVLLAVELAVLNPMLSRMIAQQAGGNFDAASVSPIGLVAVVFTIAILGGVRAGTTIASGLRLPRRGSSAPTSDAERDIRTQTAARAAAIAETPLAAAGLARTLESAARRESAAQGARLALAGSGGAVTVVGATNSTSLTAARAGAGTIIDLTPNRPAAAAAQRAVLPRASRIAARRNA